MASVLIAVAGIELALRAVGYWPDLQSGWLLDSPHRVLDRDVIVIPRRLVDPAFYARPAGKTRIVMLGDSFVEGYPVADEDTYPAVLQRVLERAGARVDVVNAGMGDSGPDQQLRLFERDLLRLRPAVVVWSFYANDLWDNVLRAVYDLDASGELVPLQGDRNWIYLRQRLFETMPLPHAVKTGSYVFRMLLRATEALHRLQLPARYRDHPAAWGAAKLRREIMAMNGLAAAHGFRVYEVLIAPEAVYLARSDPSAWEKHWALVEHDALKTILAGEAGFVDAQFDAATLGSAAIFADATRDAAAPGTRHFNEDGYRRLAELVAARLTADHAVAAPDAERSGS